MPARKRAAKSAKKKDSTAHLGFEAKLWLAADKLRNNMDAAERSGATWTTIGSPEGSRGGANQYKHTAKRGSASLGRRWRRRTSRIVRGAEDNVLGPIFLKYISDSFEAHHAKLLAGEGDYAGADPEDPDEYKAENIFWVPQEARWSHLQGRAKLPTIGKDLDDAMDAMERDNPRLKGPLPK